MNRIARFASASIIVTLATFNACDTDLGNADEIALSEGALEGGAAWTTRVELDDVRALTVTVPVSLRLRGSRAVRADLPRNAPFGSKQVTRPSPMPVPPVPCLRCAVTVRLLDRVSGELLASDRIEVGAEMDDAWLDVEVDDPCAGASSCTRSFRVEVEGPEGVIASPSFGAASDRGVVSVQADRD